jgi:DUF1680 family protein
MRSKDGIYINYFAEGTFKTTTPKANSLEIKQQTTYPKSGNIKVSVKNSKPETFAIHIRIPGWSSITRLLVNGTPIENVKPGYQTITRTWKNGDVIELETDMRGRLVYMGNKPTYAAIIRGPIVLAREEGLGGINMASILSLSADNSYGNLEEVLPKKTWMQFRLTYKPESYRESGDSPVFVDLCDYASAGNADSSAFRTWFPQLIDPKNF